MGKTVRFVELPSDAMAALLDGDLATAGEAAGVALTELFVTDSVLMRVWQLRLDPSPMRGPARGPVYAVVSEPEDVVVGQAGLHLEPDERGMIEIGYTIDPAYRRRGYAKAVVRALLADATADPRIKVVRASISPDNTASLATIRGFGFTQVGDQWDEDDGLELLFEVPV